MAEMTTAWSVDHSAYPVTGPASVQLEFLVRYAVLAPSTHNTQPWLFRVRGDSLELFADRGRALPVCDPEDRELVISCGAALGIAQLAARNFGYEGAIELLPAGGHPDLLARLRLGSRRAPDAAEARRFRAIPDRRTTRTAFATNEIPIETLATLQRLAAHRHATLVYAKTTGDREAIAELVAKADHLQMQNPAFRAELAQWLRPGHAPDGDGMSIASFGYRDNLSGAAAAVIRTFDLGAGIAARDRQLVAGSPVLALLFTDQDGPADWLRTGMALADILLEATAAGLQAAFLNQPVEIPELRAGLGAIVGSRRIPQLLMRFGRGPKVPPSGRREARLVIGG